MGRGLKRQIVRTTNLLPPLETTVPANDQMSENASIVTSDKVNETTSLEIQASYKLFLQVFIVLTVLSFEFVRSQVWNYSCIWIISSSAMIPSHRRN